MNHSFYDKPFDISADSKAPLLEIMTAQEWVERADDVKQEIYELQMYLEGKQSVDLGKLPLERLTDAVRYVRKAKNLLSWTMLLVEEQGDLVGKRIILPSGRRGFNFDLRTPSCWNWPSVQAKNAKDLAGLYCAHLRTHYLANHPELMQDRHWIFMQALGQSCCELLAAHAELAVIHSLIVPGGEEDDCL